MEHQEDWPRHSQQHSTTKAEALDTNNNNSATNGPTKAAAAVSATDTSITKQTSNNGMLQQSHDRQVQQITLHQQQQESAISHQLLSKSRVSIMQIDPGDDEMAADRIASVLWNEAERPAPSLECLAISLSVAKAMLGRGPCPCPILFLVVHGLHQDTPMQLLTALLASFPSARQIAFTRDEPEDEYMSFYSDVPDPSTSRHYINQDTIKQFNLCQNNVLVTLTNDREKIDGLTMHHW